jgi:hypothetical protein
MVYMVCAVVALMLFLNGSCFCQSRTAKHHTVQERSHMIHPQLLLPVFSARAGNMKISGVPSISIPVTMLRTLALLITLAVGAHAQTPATLEAQIVILSAKIAALEALVVVQTAENASLQKKITLLQSNETMQAANLAALITSFTPVQSAVSATQGTDAAQSAAISAIQAQLNLVAANPALALGPFVSVNLAPTNGLTGPIVTFSGVNVQIENGTGATGLTNGLGNLFVGYALPNPSNNYDPVPLPLYRNGSHSIIIGDGHSFSGFSNLICGGYNRTQGDGQFIAGYYNSAGYGGYNSILGGVQNYTFGSYDVVVGGSGNSVNSPAMHAVILGGTYGQEFTDEGVLLGGDNVFGDGPPGTVTQ